MNDNYTDLTILLDNSPSMGNIVDATIEGFNGLLAKQKKVSGELKVTLIKFSGAYEYRVIYEAVPISMIANLTRKDYCADGNGTALLDAMAKCVETTGQRLAKMNHNERPGKVLVVVITDGEENMSIKYPRYGGGKTRVNQMVKHQIDKYNWDFSFIGAGLDEITAEESYGDFSKLNSVSVARPKIRAVYESFSNKLNTYCNLVGANTVERNSTLSFTNQEKAELKSES